MLPWSAVGDIRGITQTHPGSFYISAYLLSLYEYIQEY